MTKRILKLWLVIAAVALLIGQALTVVLRVGEQSVTFNRLPLSVVTFTAASGQASDSTNTATFPVSISTTRRPPGGIQFDLTFPAADVTSITAATGPAATAAGKSITCAAPTGTTGTFRCLVAGLNTSTIANGVVANITVVVSKTTSFSLTNLVASTAAATALGVAADPPNSVGAFAGVVSLLCVVPPYDSGLPPGTYNLEPGETISCSAALAQAAPQSGLVLPLAITGSGVMAPGSVVFAGGATMSTFTVTGQ